MGRIVLYVESIISHANGQENDREMRGKGEASLLPKMGGSYPNSGASGSCREAAELPTRYCWWPRQGA